MATIMIEDAPESVAKSFGYKVSYKKITSSFLPKGKEKIQKSQKITENGFTEEFEDQCLKNEKDPNNTSYGPMEFKDFLKEMKKW